MFFPLFSLQQISIWCCKASRFWILQIIWKLLLTVVSSDIISSFIVHSFFVFPTLPMRSVLKQHKKHSNICLWYLLCELKQFLSLPQFFFWTLMIVIFSCKKRRRRVILCCMMLIREEIIISEELLQNQIECEYNVKIWETWKCWIG